MLHVTILLSTLHIQYCLRMNDAEESVAPVNGPQKVGHGRYIEKVGKSTIHFKHYHVVTKPDGKREVLTETSRSESSEDESSDVEVVSHWDRNCTPSANRALSSAPSSATRLPSELRWRKDVFTHTPTEVVLSHTPTELGTFSPTKIPSPTSPALVVPTVPRPTPTLSSDDNDISVPTVARPLLPSPRERSNERHGPGSYHDKASHSNTVRDTGDHDSDKPTDTEDHSDKPTATGDHSEHKRHKPTDTGDHSDKRYKPTDTDYGQARPNPRSPFTETTPSI